MLFPYMGPSRFARYSFIQNKKKVAALLRPLLSQNFWRRGDIYPSTGGMCYVKNIENYLFGEVTMFLRVLLGVLFVISGKIYAFEYPLVILEYIDDTKVIAYINESDIDKALSWLPSEGPPPLSIASVVDVIQKHVALDPDITNAKFTEIELKQIPHHENQWHYLVLVETKDSGHLGLHYFAVLMNGKVIPAIEEPES